MAPTMVCTTLRRVSSGTEETRGRPAGATGGARRARTRVRTRPCAGRAPRGSRCPRVEPASPPRCVRSRKRERRRRPQRGPKVSRRTRAPLPGEPTRLPPSRSLTLGLQRGHRPRFPPRSSWIRRLVWRWTRGRVWRMIRRQAPPMTRRRGFRSIRRRGTLWTPPRVTWLVSGPVGGRRELGSPNHRRWTRCPCTFRRIVVLRPWRREEARSGVRAGETDEVGEREG